MKKTIIIIITIFIMLFITILGIKITQQKSKEYFENKIENEI